MKKAQTALEYLMTYGWAILIVVIVIGALYALGLTKPCKWVGTQVREFPDFRVENVKVTTTEASFDVNYVKPGNVELQRILVWGDATGTDTTIAGTILPPAKRVTVSITFSPAKPSGDCYSLGVAIEHNITTAGGEVTFNSTGKIDGVIS